MLVFDTVDVGHSLQVLANQLSQNAVSFAVQDAYMTHAGENGIVDEVLNLVQRLVASHAADVDFLLECAAVFVNGVSGHSAHRRHLRFRRLWCVGMFQSFQPHLRAHAAKYGDSSLAVDALQSANGSLSFDAYRVTRF